MATIHEEPSTNEISLIKIINEKTSLIYGLLSDLEFNRIKFKVVFLFLPFYNNPHCPTRNESQFLIKGESKRYSFSNNRKREIMTFFRTRGFFKK